MRSTWIQQNQCPSWGGLPSSRRTVRTVRYGIDDPLIDDLPSLRMVILQFAMLVYQSVSCLQPIQVKSVLKKKNKKKLGATWLSPTTWLSHRKMMAGEIAYLHAP